MVRFTFIKKYGEILFTGKCNLKCFYCLNNDVGVRSDTMNIHFNEWKNFDAFISKCKEQNYDTIYLSSVCTEPTLYKYFSELVDYLISEGFKVGIRTNGYFTEDKLESICKMEEEISFSINSLNPETNKLICGTDKIPDWEHIFNYLNEHNRNFRVSIVVNSKNYTEITDILDYLKDFKNISYVQLREVYKYNSSSKAWLFDKASLDDTGLTPFFMTKRSLQKKFQSTNGFYESEQCIYKNIRVSFWDGVFSKSSVKSLNYFTDGILSSNNILVDAYNEKEVKDFYTNDYNEDCRLSENCDNRHRIEREIKTELIRKYAKGEVLDVGAGTGLYSLILKNNGLNVKSIDLVEKHVEIMKSKGLDAIVGSATCLPYEDNSFDTVIVAGPMYHLDENGQKKALLEAMRICRHGGIILVDYLSDYHAYIQKMILNHKEIQNSGKFYYSNAEKMRNMAQRFNLIVEKIYALDGITRFIKDDINSFSEYEFGLYKDFIMAHNTECVDLSEHCMMVLLKL